MRVGVFIKSLDYKDFCYVQSTYLLSTLWWKKKGSELLVLLPKSLHVS